MVFALLRRDSLLVFNICFLTNSNRTPSITAPFILLISTGISTEKNYIRLINPSKTGLPSDAEEWKEMDEIEEDFMKKYL